MTLWSHSNSGDKVPWLSVSARIGSRKNLLNFSRIVVGGKLNPATKVFETFSDIAESSTLSLVKDVFICKSYAIVVKQLKVFQILRAHTFKKRCPKQNLEWMSHRLSKGHNRYRRANAVVKRNNSPNRTFVLNISPKISNTCKNTYNGSLLNNNLKVFFSFFVLPKYKGTACTFGSTLVMRHSVAKQACVGSTTNCDVDHQFGRVTLACPMAAKILMPVKCNELQTPPDDILKLSGIQSKASCRV